MLLSSQKPEEKLIALRYERNAQVQHDAEDDGNNEKSREIYTENLLWALNECESNDLSVDDRTAFDDIDALTRPKSVRRPVTASVVKNKPLLPNNQVNGAINPTTTSCSRKYIVHCGFPLLVNDYFQFQFQNAKLVRNLSLIQDYQVDFSSERMSSFHANIIKSYCNLLDSYESL